MYVYILDQKLMFRRMSHLLSVSHGAPPSNHDLAASLCLQLLCCESTRAKNSPNKIILEKQNVKIGRLESIQKLRAAFIENRMLCINTIC